MSEVHHNFEAGSQSKGNPMKERLVDAFWLGDVGEVEFVELALDAGMSMDEINQVLNDVREEDGVL